jgi:hypothetical protein
MCTSIARHAPLTGSAKGPDGWFALDAVRVGYDHPSHADLEHALLVDLVAPAGPDGLAGRRLALELPRDAARALVATITAALAEADAYEGEGAEVAGSR